MCISPVYGKVIARLMPTIESIINNTQKAASLLKKRLAKNVLKNIRVF